MMIDAPGMSDEDDVNIDHDEITLTEDNAEEVMRYFNNMIS